MTAQLENGARFNFTRVTTRDELTKAPTVVYLVEVERPSAESHSTKCELSASEKVPKWSEIASGPPLEGWMVKTREALTRQLQRSGARGQWPRKIRQWKKEPSS
jgi:hypothetical protein